MHHRQFAHRYNGNCDRYRMKNQQWLVIIGRVSLKLNSTNINFLLINLLVNNCCQPSMGQFTEAYRLSWSNLDHRWTRWWVELFMGIYGLQQIRNGFSYQALLYLDILSIMSSLSFPMFTTHFTIALMESFYGRQFDKVHNKVMSIRFFIHDLLWLYYR